MNNNGEEIKHGDEQNNHQHQHQDPYDPEVGHLRHVYGHIDVHYNKQHGIDESPKHTLEIILFVPLKKSAERADIGIAHNPLAYNRKQCCRSWKHSERSQNSQRPVQCNLFVRSTRTRT
ncbi:hypothetical protein D3C74_385340 [compost metagenome]